MDKIRFCPALLIGAPASSHGKTTVTAALARFHAERGLRVRVFKCGPDFLDASILRHAVAGSEALQLDLWMAGAEACRALVYQAAADADLILIEGVMGLFDGDPCSADLAELLDVPVVAVIDARGAAQTVGAVGFGLAHYREGLRFAGVFANGVASPRHAEMIAAGMPPGMACLGGLPRNTQFTLPQRHLGLVVAGEVEDLDQRLQQAALAMAATALSQLPVPVAFEPAVAQEAPRLLAGVRIGVARDAAFCFLYAANLALLREMGASLFFFSPLADAALPEVDSLYLPGGYPELHLQKLQDNQEMHTALRRHHAQGKPIYAECGGMLYLLQSLTDVQGKTGTMAGLLPGNAVLQPRLQGLGYQSAPFPGGTLRAHTFHHSTLQAGLTPLAYGERLHNTSPGEAIYCERGLTATYLHSYFPSNPAAAASLFNGGATCV